MPIGWWGIPGSQRAVDVTKTHVVAHTRTNLCGAKVRREMEFQYCSEVSLTTVNSIECRRCRAKTISFFNVPR